MIYKSINTTAEIASSLLTKELIKNGIPTRTLNEVCSLITDGEHQTPERSFLGFPLLTAKNVRDGYIDLTEVDFVAGEIAIKCWNRCKPQIDDILMTCVGTIGRLAVIKEKLDAVLVRSVALLRPRTNIILPDYLAEMLNAFQIKNKMQLQIRESAQPGLYLSQVKALEIPVPDLITQSLIASFINWCKSPYRQEVPSPSLPQKIEFVQHTIERVDKIVAKIEEARGVRREAVGETNTLLAAFISQKFSGENISTRNKRQLEDYVIDDCYGTSEKTMDDSDGVPILRMGNIQDGRITTSELKYLYLNEQEKDKQLLKKGDILVNAMCKFPCQRKDS